LLGKALEISAEMAGSDWAELSFDQALLFAAYSNARRNFLTRGIEGSTTDCLYCDVAARRGHAIFTTDGDFAEFAGVIPVRLHRPRA
jgi:predicted nucleic acid-binding protein